MQLASTSAAAMSMHVRTRSQEDQENIALEERYPDTALSSGFTTPLARSTASSIHSSSYHQHEESLPLADTDTGYAEGGFGWVVTACTFVICFHSLGFIYAWGVVQAQIEHDKILSATTAAWLGGVLAFVNAAVCPLGHVIIEKFGPRNTCIASMSGMGITLIATSFTFKYPVALFIFQGFLYGTCSAITFIATYCLPSTWFRRKRGFATGIVSAGAGLGGAVWSIVIQKAISTLGLGWAYRIMGLSVLVFCVPTATLLKTGVPVSRPTGQSLPAEQSLFRSGLFLRLLASCFIVAYPFFIPSFFLPSYAHSIGLSSSTGALLSAAYNLASGVGRIGFGILADTATGNYQAFIIALLSVSLSTILVWPFAISTAGVLGFAIWCGLGSGGFFSLQSSLVGQILGSHRVPQAIAVIESVSSIGFLIGPPTAGILLEAFGGISGGPDAFKPAMYLAGSATFLAVLLACSVRWSLEKRLWVKV